MKQRDLIKKLEDGNYKRSDYETSLSGFYRKYR